MYLGTIPNVSEWSIIISADIVASPVPVQVPSARTCNDGLDIVVNACHHPTSPQLQVGLHIHTFVALGPMLMSTYINW
jgi:hypothetical protein